MSHEEQEIYPRGASYRTCDRYIMRACVFACVRAIYLCLLLRSAYLYVRLSVCVGACMRACMRACVRECVPLAHSFSHFVLRIYSEIEGCLAEL